MDERSTGSVVHLIARFEVEQDDPRSRIGGKGRRGGQDGPIAFGPRIRSQQCGVEL